VPVERKKKFQCVLVEHFHSGVKKCDCKQLSIGTIANGKDVVGHFEGAGMDKRYDFPALIRRSCTVKRKLMEEGRLTDSPSDCCHSIFQNLISLSAPPVTKAC